MQQKLWDGNPHLRGGRPRTQSRNRTEEAQRFCNLVTSFFGGRGRLIALTGARQFRFDPISPALTWRFQGSTRANKIQVIQQPGKPEFFHILFWKVARDGSCEEFVSEFYMIPGERLALKFTEFTNLIL